jgi:hypothetical protein
VANAKEEAGAGNVEKAGIKIAYKIAYEIAYKIDGSSHTGTGTGDLLPYADPHSLSYLLGAN